MPHTPGDWVFFEDSPDEMGVYVRNADGSCGPQIAQINTENVDNVEQARADGRVIALVPRLLAICKEIAQDKRCDLVDSERRIRLYSVLHDAREL